MEKPENRNYYAPMLEEEAEYAREQKEKDREKASPYDAAAAAAEDRED